MQVKFTIDYDLIELVDAIGLDYDIVDAESDLIDDYKEIEITIEDAEYFLDDHQIFEKELNDDELCEYLLHPDLKDGVIRIKYELVS